jgi:quinol monooxygenase YgiN
MIVLAGTITFDPDRSDDLLAAVAVVVEATRAEEGCLEYVMAADPLVAGQLNLFERWEAEEHLGAHQRADHSRTFQRTLRDCGVAGVSVDRYEVSGVTKIL